MQGNVTGTINGLASGAQGEVKNQIIAALQTDTPIDGKTIAQILSYMAAMLCGKTTGAGTGSEVYKSLNGTTDRVTVAINANGNRDTVTFSG